MEADTEPRQADQGSSRQAIDPFKVALLLMLFSATAVLCILSFATAYVFSQGTESLERFGASLGAPQPTAVVSTEAVVVRTLSGASELATAAYAMETIVAESRDRTLGPWTVGDTELLYVAHGQVKAGVDLSRLGPEDVSATDSQVEVFLPPPEILDAKIDVEKSYVYDLDRSLFGPVDPDLQSRAERYALEQIVIAACDAGLLDEAGSRAESVVKMLLEPMLDGSVAVRTHRAPPDDCRTPVSPPDRSE